MVDFATLKTKLADHLGADLNRLSDSVRGDLINEAVRELCRGHDWLFNQVRGNITTVIGQQGYTVADFSRPLQMWYPSTSTPSQPVYIDQISREEYVDRFPDATNSSNRGTPTHYTFFSAGSSVSLPILLGPAPDSVFTISFDYLRLLPDLVNASDEHMMTVRAWEPVLYRALVSATRYLMEDSRIPLFEELAQKHERLVTIEQARSQTDGFRPISREPG